ncbi:MAG: ATP-dependent DNA helicase RecG [Treponema sp.]|nr:ATP-dependent DNA helicase RecG [Treponema sp.]
MKLSDLNTSVESLGGIGPATAKVFANLNIFTVAQLLQTFPRDYTDRTKRVPLCDFATDPVHTICQVTAHNWFGYGRMKTLKLAITDGTALAWLVAFNRPFLEKALPEGCIAAVTGKFEVKYNELQSTAFEAERLSYEGPLSDFENMDIPGSGVIPVYPLTQGLSQKNFRKTVAQALRQYGKAIDDDLPAEIIERRMLMHKAEALKCIHNPQSMAEAQAARHTFIYEELYNFEQKLAERSLAHRGVLPAVTETALFEHDDTAPKSAAPSCAVPEETEEQKAARTAAFVAELSPRQKQLHERLTFSLTSGQMQAILEMNTDIDKSAEAANTLNISPQTLKTSPFSMQRLLQGDVGSGKTLVALFICLRVIDYGGQCAFMAPTELLARQHAENAARLLQGLSVRIAFLTGNVSTSGRTPLLSSLKAGEIDIVVGTHALFSRTTEYNNLQLAVIDEQHRFGVTQREAIVAKGRKTVQNGTAVKSHSPNVLMMSATPIPQTLALTVFGDLDVSTIRTMPQGRKPIKTFLSVMGHERNVYEAVRKELNAGHQAYFVYPRIGEDETTSATSNSTPQEPSVATDSDETLKSAEDMFVFLSEQVYPRYRVALIHSKIEEETQNHILAEFRSGAIQVLVATTVVEVGVDVPNATAMVIENADRFGLAALHQLRGRVGRGSSQSYCFLIYGKNITDIGRERMKALYSSTDGFVIAEQDLQLRGPGEVSGTAQSGYLALGIADFERDRDTLVQARYDAFTVAAQEYGAKNKTAPAPRQP